MQQGSSHTLMLLEGNAVASHLVFLSYHSVLCPSGHFPPRTALQTIATYDICHVGDCHLNICHSSNRKQKCRYEQGTTTIRINCVILY